MIKIRYKKMGIRLIRMRRWKEGRRSYRSGCRIYRWNKIWREMKMRSRLWCSKRGRNYVLSTCSGRRRNITKRVTRSFIKTVIKKRGSRSVGGIIFVKIVRRMNRWRMSE